MIANNNFQLPHGKSHYLLSILLAIFLFGGTFACFIFVPELILPANNLNFGCRSLFDAFNGLFINQSLRGLGWSFNSGLFAGGILFWIFQIALVFSTIFFGWFLFRLIIMLTIYPQWFRRCLSKHEEIINSCSNMQIQDSVAMVVPTCNDFLPNTLLQTAKQTYKNMDIWICDDSSNPDIIAKIDQFCKEHNFNVIHRDPAHKKLHPTKVGNLFYFLEKIGNKYDYIFENDSSSIVTSSFVENCLCYFKTPLWDHAKDGAIISNGSFYGGKNVIGYLTSKALQISESMLCGGGANHILGGPVMINGWGAMYKTSTLMKIPLERVECPICDSARGLWLTLNGYQNYLNPFDFTAKWCPQTMEGIKNQKLKWNGGDVFVFRTGLINSKYPNWKADIYVKFFDWQITIFTPLSLIFMLGLSILSMSLSFVYFNLTSTIIIALIWIIPALILVIILIVNKACLATLIFAGFAGLIEVSILFKRCAQIVVRGFIQKKWSSGAVTAKKNIKTGIRQKLRMSLFDGMWLLGTVAICLIITFCSNVPPLAIWTGFFFSLAGPSIVYIIFVWIGEIRVGIGYDDRMIEYNFWLHDFRYKFVKESNVWKKQHPTNV